MTSLLRRLVRNQRGGASIAVAVIMAMFIVSSFVQNVVMREQVVRAMDQERLNELIRIDAVFFNAEGRLAIDLTNTGGVPAHLEAVWVQNDTLHDRTELDSTLNIQQEFRIEIDVSALDFTVDDIFIVKVVTERGNVYSTTYAPNPPEAIKDGGIFKVNWFYCQYATQSQPIPLDARQISIDERYVAFYLEVTNDWIYPCTLKEWSVLTLVITHIEPLFFISAGVEYDGTPSVTPYESLVVNPQESVVVTFAGVQPSSNEFAWEYDGWGQNFPEGLRHLIGPQEVAGIQISLMFEMNGELLGQTISTQAILLYDP